MTWMLKPRRLIWQEKLFFLWCLIHFFLLQNVYKSTLKHVSWFLYVAVWRRYFCYFVQQFLQWMHNHVDLCCLRAFCLWRNNESPTGSGRNACANKQIGVWNRRSGRRRLATIEGEGKSAAGGDDDDAAAGTVLTPDWRWISQFKPSTRSADRRKVLSVVLPHSIRPTSLTPRLTDMYAHNYRLLQTEISVQHQD